MAQAPDYNRSKDFTVDAADNTDHAALNTELDQVSVSINTLNSNIALIQGSDGKLLPDAVTLDSVSDEVIDFIADSIEQEIHTDILRAEEAAVKAETAQTSAEASASQSLAAASSASSYAGAADSSATAAANSASQALQYKNESGQIKNDVQALVNDASASATAAAGSAQQAAQSRQESAGFRDEAKTHADAAAASADLAASHVQQSNQLIKECVHIRDDARLAATAAAASANTAAESATAAATSATGATGSANAAASSVNTALSAAQSSGAHAALAEASKDAAIAAAAKAQEAADSAKDNAESAQSTAMSATAGGTPDVITACFKGGVGEPPKDHLIMYVRAIGANTSTTPTFKPGSASARVIVKGNNQPLSVGDIAGSGYEMILQYNAEYDKFVLLNPAYGVFMSAESVGTLKMWPSQTLPADGKWMERNGAVLNITDYPELFSIIGTTFGGDGTATFALPDDRGLVERGWDNGRGYDEGRVLGSEQMDQMQRLFGQIKSKNNVALGYINTSDIDDNSSGIYYGSYGNYTYGGADPAAGQGWQTLNIDTARFAGARTGEETTMKNRAYLPIIKVLP